MHEGHGVTSFIISVSKGSNNMHNELSEYKSNAWHILCCNGLRVKVFMRSFVQVFQDQFEAWFKQPD